MSRSAAIVGTGAYVPGEPIANDYFDRLYGRDIGAFLRERRHINSRHFMAAGEATSDLILPAAREALAEAHLDAANLDLIIVATDTPDYLSPATAAVVQHKLGASRAGTFDLNAACAGFVTALDVAANYIVANPRLSNVLVVGAYGMSRYLDRGDYKTSSLFADGAGAVVLSATTDGMGVLASQLRTDGQFHDYMGIFGGGTRLPLTAEALAKGDRCLRFVKKIPVEMNGQVWPEMTRVLLDRLGRRPMDVAHYFLTQINIDSIHETMDALGVPRQRSHNIMDRFAYTGSACIPMAIADAARASKLRRGDLVVLLASGGGTANGGLGFDLGV